MNDKPTMVDQSALRFNQASIITLLALAFVLNQPWLVVFVAALMPVAINHGLATTERLLAQIGQANVSRNL